MIVSKGGTPARRYAKRKCRQVYRHADTMILGLGMLAQMFQQDHPDIAHDLLLIAEGVVMLQDNLSQWYGKVWGSPPGDWYSDN